MTVRSRRPALAVAVVLALSGCGKEGTVVMPCDPPIVAVVWPVADTIPVGGSVSFAGEVHFGCDYQRSPMEWTIQDPAVASVSSSTDSTAQVIGLAPGDTRVVYSAVGDPYLRFGAYLTVVAGPAAASGRAPAPDLPSR